MIAVCNVDGETLFSESVNSFEKAEEALGRAERYIGRKEAQAILETKEIEI